MHTQTYYAATAPRLTFAPLTGENNAVEVAVLGGGFAGLATARGLQERGAASVAVLEAQAIGHGASGRNGGFVFGGYSRDAADLVGDLGLAPARELYARSREAVALIRSRIDAHAIDCDKVEGGALEVRLDGCEGEPIATLPLAPARTSDGLTTLKAPLPALGGRHDLCFTFASGEYNPMWVIDEVALLPGAP